MKERMDRPSITVFGGRFIEERYFVMTLVDFLAHCGIRGEDEPFGARANGKMYLVLTARKVSDQITGTRQYGRRQVVPNKLRSGVQGQELHL